MPLTANYSRKAQFKVQEMAFTVVAILIFFGIGAVFLLLIVSDNLNNQVENQRGEEAKEIVRKISVSPELAFTEKGCESCIDMDKALALKNNEKYDDFFDLEYLKIITIYPNKTGECTRDNFPDCQTITLIGEGNKDFGITQGTYVSLCRYEFKTLGYYRCELGKVMASGEGLE
jgi:hypothetical protein